MRKPTASRTVRRSVALPRRLVDQATALATPELPRSFNGIVRAALREFVARRQAQAFEQAMGKMARDPAIRRELARMGRSFAAADSDGLDHD